MTPLEKWLSDATRGLSAESADRVRREIQEHYDSTSEAGEDGIAALGNPQAANRAYRNVLLTEQEAMMAPALAQPNRRSFRSGLFALAVLVLLLWPLATKSQGPGFWPVMFAIFCTTPLPWFLPANTLERSRIYAYIGAVRGILVVSVAWWYQGWITALVLGAICLLLDYFINHRRLSVFRKLAAGQSYSLLPGEPQLTHLEAIHLRTLRTGSPHENVLIPMLFLMLAAMAVWQPAAFGPMAVWMAAGFVARRTLPVYTEERSRWFRIAKWASMAVAAVLPAVLGARAPWIGAAYLAFFFWLVDLKSISLRRKLPVAEWPKRLYW